MGAELFLVDGQTRDEANSRFFPQFCEHT